MSDIGIRPRMLVKDVMISPVITVEQTASANEVACLMLDNKVGCVIVVDKEGNPIGIITERDLIVRVLAKKIEASNAKAKSIMTAPLTTVDPDTAVTDAARMMNRKDIRRLGVLYKGKLAGIVSSKDILGVMPELLEIIQERSRIEGGSVLEPTEELEEAPFAGDCERCEAYSENLKNIGGKYLCEDCRAEEAEK
ncbi:MAG TPA: CBS domain-containing protein [Candidatus Sulfotelmatobacter sp.]|nr:CBS domain-containing protein [Candidatus Sulfotelmatobacter sp.]